MIEILYLFRFNIILKMNNDFTTQTDFKSTLTHNIYTLDLKLNNKTCNIYTNIEHQLLDLLELSHSEFKIILYTLTNETIEENDEKCFTYHCDCVEYPAFYFKPILYTDLASNLEPNDITHLIQQNEPYSDDDDDDDDYLLNLLSYDNSSDDDIDSHTILSQ